MNHRSQEFFPSFPSNTFSCKILEPHHIPYNTHHSNSQAPSPPLGSARVLLHPLEGSVPNSLLNFQQTYLLPPNCLKFISVLSIPS